MSRLPLAHVAGVTRPRQLARMSHSHDLNTSAANDQRPLKSNASSQQADRPPGRQTQSDAGAKRRAERQRDTAGRPSETTLVRPTPMPDEHDVPYRLKRGPPAAAVVIPRLGRAQPHLAMNRNFGYQNGFFNNYAASSTAPSEPGFGAASSMTTSVSGPAGFLVDHTNSVESGSSGTHHFGFLHQSHMNFATASSGAGLASSTASESTFFSGAGSRFGLAGSSLEQDDAPTACNFGQSPPDRLATRAELMALSSSSMTEAECSPFFTLTGFQGQQTCVQCEANHRGTYSSCGCSCHENGGGLGSGGGSGGLDGQFGVKSPSKSVNCFSVAHSAFPALVTVSTEEANATGYGSGAPSLLNGSSRFGGGYEERPESPSPNTSLELAGDVRSVNLMLHDQKPLFT